MASESIGEMHLNTEREYHDAQNYEQGDWNDYPGDDYVDFEGEEDESRELTHEEIWDDSALIDAWDAANEEYEVRFLIFTSHSMQGVYSEM